MEKRKSKGGKVGIGGGVEGERGGGLRLGGGPGAHGDPLLSLAGTTAAADPEPPTPRNVTPTSRLSKARTALQEGREEWRFGPGMPAQRDTTARLWRKTGIRGRAASVCLFGLTVVCL